MILSDFEKIKNYLRVPRVGGGDPPEGWTEYDRFKCSPRRRG